MLAKLTALLLAYGPGGILLLAFIDSAGIPVASGIDALVILMAAKAPSRAYLAASMGVLGSLVGNMVLFLAARAGAMKFIQEVPKPGNQQRLREWFRRYGLLTVFVPAALPIPLPMKIFVIFAAMVPTRVRSFVLVILVARSMRYFGEAYLGASLGPGSARFLRSHAWLLLGSALMLFAVLYAALVWRERRRV
jgi:membrane protein YqaA with SNARE-associated domain